MRSTHNTHPGHRSLTVAAWWSSLAGASSVVAAIVAVAACDNAPQAAQPANDTTQVTVLARPSDTVATGWDGAAAPAAPTASAPASGDTPTATTATPGELKSKDPGTYVVDGYVVRSQQCAPCPPGVHCKPCAVAIYISAQKPAGADPADTVDVQATDSSPYAPGAHYRFVVTVTQSANQSTRRLFSATPQQ